MAVYSCIFFHKVSYLFSPNYSSRPTYRMQPDRSPWGMISLYTLNLLHQADKCEQEDGACLP